MGDVSALEKQLNVKTKQIAELQVRDWERPPPDQPTRLDLLRLGWQATLDEKSRKLFDYSDTLENKVAFLQPFFTH